MVKYMKMNSNAKLNLFLEVTGKRKDGYHDIVSVMQEIDLYDEIIVEETSEGISICCDDKNVPCDEKNTCYKAAKLIKDKFSITEGVKIIINKKIPSEAGLGGGSSNAASVIKLLNDLWNLNMNIEEMCGIGVEIGADVPFCIVGGTCLCEGIGEKITKLTPFIWQNIVIVKPEFGISTPKAYSKLTPKNYNVQKNCDFLSFLKAKKYENVCLSVYNALEIPAIEMEPSIVDIKEQFLALGAISSLMTGSGSAIFGFFPDYNSANGAYNIMSRIFKDTFFVKTLAR